MIVLQVLCVLVLGCADKPQAAKDGVVLFIPGVSGDGPWYDNLKRGLRDGGVTLPIESFAWGAPAPLFMLNFNTVSIHDTAERQLTDRITAFGNAHPHAPIIILTHSAGGGVALGALSLLRAEVLIDRIVLLHSSVAPAYDLTNPLSHVRQTLTHFHSDRDTMFLKWRTSNFGTYDNVKTTAAGNLGFDLSALDPRLRAKVIQMAYQKSYASLGHAGGHFGPVSRDFARAIVAPVLRTAEYDHVGRDRSKVDAVLPD